MLVLDEADRLLDLGFESDLREALALLSRPTAGAGTGSGSAPNGTPALRAHSRRTLLFSATFSPPIRALAADLLEPSALRLPSIDRQSWRVPPQTARQHCWPAAAEEKGAGAMQTSLRRRPR